MKFTINSKELAQRVGNVSKVQQSKNALPILDCILFQVKDGMLTLIASDSELTLSTQMEVMDSQDGCVAIESKQFLSAIKEISDRPITISVEDNTNAVLVDYGSGKYNFIGQNGTEFPLPVSIGESTVSEIESATIAAGINFAFKAMANDELRPQMNGIYFDDTPTGYTMVASDGHKLSKYTKRGTAKGGKSFIMPAKAVAILRNIIKDGEVLSVAVGQTTLRIDNICGYTLQGRIVEGRYPNYNSVIPQGYTQSAIFSRQDAIAALRRVGVFGSASTGLVKIQLTEGSKMVISAKDIDFSTSAEEIIAADYNGSDFAIGLSLGFFADELNALKSEQVEMKYGDAERAVLVLPVTDKETDEEYLQLLMPMMLNE